MKLGYGGIRKYSSLSKFHYPGGMIKLKDNIRYFSSKSDNNKLHPWFITGFTDGEGCFSVYISKNNELKVG
jgi:hypothetical protein